MAHRFLVETFSPVVDHLATVAVNSGGTGYAVDDILTIVGGTGSAATVRVTSESGGVIDGVSIETSGSYTVNPSTPNSATGGGGSSVSLDVGFATEETWLMVAKALMDAAVLGRVIGVAVVAGGTGYVVDDEITLSTGTSLFAARFRVSSVAAGVVDGIDPVSCGAYSTLPDVTSASHATTGGTGTGLTVDVATEAPHSAVFAAAGTGYVVGDIVTLSGGSLHAGESASQFIVTGETAGVVDTVEPYRIGRYDTLPTNPVTTTGGTGSSLTLTLTQESFIHSGENSENYFDGITPFELWLEGVNLAGTNPQCGVKAHLNGNSSPIDEVLGLRVATAFSDAVTFDNQVGGSPTQFATLTTVGIGACIPMTASGSATLFASYQPRRVAFVVSMSPSYETGHLGCFVPFIDSPSTFYPAPFMVSGTISVASIEHNQPFIGQGTNQESSQHASFLHGGENSPTFPITAIREQTGTWRQFEPEASNDLPAIRFWPYESLLENADTAPNIDLGVGNVLQINTNVTQQNAILQEIGNSTGLTNVFTRNGNIFPSPFGPGGDDLYYLAPIIVWREDNAGAQDIYGEIEGFYAIQAIDLNAEDRIKDGAGQQFFVYPDTTSSADRRFIALLEGSNAL